jgi:DNA-binding NtrC family response regulator
MEFAFRPAVNMTGMTERRLASGPIPATATVLIVESDHRTRAEMAHWLRDAGYAAREAATFEEARAALASAPPAVLVASLRLGAYNGLHLVISARAARPALRAVVVTNADDSAVADEAREAGAVYLAKPIRRHALLEAVDRRRQNT